MGDLVGEGLAWLQRQVGEVQRDHVGIPPGLQTPGGQAQHVRAGLGAHRKRRVRVEHSRVAGELLGFQ